MTTISPCTKATRSKFSGRYRMSLSIAALPRRHTGSWGLRDYGTGEWEGGDPECDHLGAPFRTKAKLNENWGAGFSDVKNTEGREPMRQECSKCGARRVDHQLGLEETPDLYIARMVEVFREVRRVLAKHGTCWVNMGDSYVSTAPGTRDKADSGTSEKLTTSERFFDLAEVRGNRTRPKTPPGLKPKDLVMMPAELAIALRADGWYLRSEIVWFKSNPMPESVTDRPTKAHEMIYLLSKSPQYYFDQEAVREPSVYPDDNRKARQQQSDYTDRAVTDRIATINPLNARTYPQRNIRSVWSIPTQSFSEAHFATYPEELVRRCILAGCPEQVCRVCGKPRERVVDVSYENPGNRTTNGPRSLERRHETAGFETRLEKRTSTTDWTSCECADYRAGIVLDPFLGSGTTALVARKHGRHAVGIELSPAYAEMAARRLSQLSLLAEASPDTQRSPSTLPASGTSGRDSGDSQEREIASTDAA